MWIGDSKRTILGVLLTGTVLSGSDILYIYDLRTAKNLNGSFYADAGEAASEAIPELRTILPDFRRYGTLSYPVREARETGIVNQIIGFRYTGIFIAGLLIALFNEIAFIVYFVCSEKNERRIRRQLGARRSQLLWRQCARFFFNLLCGSFLGWLIYLFLSATLWKHIDSAILYIPVLLVLFSMLGLCIVLTGIFAVILTVADIPKKQRLSARLADPDPGKEAGL